jgi:hypothetical protein
MAVQRAREEEERKERQAREDAEAAERMSKEERLAAERKAAKDAKVRVERKTLCRTQGRVKNEYEVGSREGEGRG